MTHDPRSPMAAQREQQRATAARLGFGTGPDAVAQLNRTHDPCHVVVARLLGLAYSPTLRWVASGYREVAHPTRHDDAIGVEEDIVLGLQEFVQTGRFNGAIRILWLFGHDPDAVRALCQHLGRDGDR